jgi:hypothetical protein
MRRRAFFVLIGSIINATGYEILDVDRAQQPLFCLHDGSPVFEIWFYHRRSTMWFVLTCDPGFSERGAVAIHPLHTRAQTTQLRDQWSAYAASQSAGF